ncbi:hypothetical protein KCU71_g17432, partial [Aureobasidium melanogenum]
MNLILRAYVSVPKTSLTSLFSRSFSFYHAFQQPDKESYAELRLNNPEAYKPVQAQKKLYYDRVRQDPAAWRRLLDRRAEQIHQWRRDPKNKAKIQAATQRFRDAHKGDERRKFYARLKNWCGRHAWVREQLPWKTYRPICHDDMVEHHCSGCNWTKRGGKKFWWKKIQTSPAADSGTWLCHNCYVPTTDWAKAMPKGYEDLGTATLKEMIKRRDSLGHGD